MITLGDIQRKVGVTADGILGPATLSAIAKALGMTSGRPVNAAGQNLIKSFEGCKLAAYPDPATGGDPWTVGFGATGPEIVRGVVWTQAQADARFIEDINRFAAGVESLLGGAPTTDNEFSAMVSLAYNVGLGNFRTSTLLRLHKEGDTVGAKAQFARWSRANGQVMRGLERRREAEAQLYGAA
jgi:lysozyme